ncbi:MAG: carbohydrate kinase family protein [Candidatus Magasanikbacteria bacterium]|nr:carbohydrate kinase family protein [Candidatus Magasanikbacteria bacterium]
MYDIITIGDAVIDTHVNIDNASVECDVNTRACQLCLDYAGKIPITDSFQTLGGNAANVACGTAKLGLRTAILTTLGDDSNGKLIVSELKKFGVNTSLVQYDQKTKTRYSVVLNFRGERTILSYHEKRNYRWPKKSPPTDWIYFTSMSEGFEPVQDQLLEYIDKHQNVKLVFNPGSFQLKSSIAQVKEILPKTDLLIVNLEEAERILGTTFKKEKSIRAIIHKLLSLGAKEVAITDAARGASAGNEEEMWTIPTYPVEVVAKTGAGDAFSAGYVAARFNNHDIQNALKWGIANSTSVITQHGPQKGLADEKKIKLIISKNSSVVPKRIA